MGKLARTSGELRINGAKDEMHRYQKVSACAGGGGAAAGGALCCRIAYDADARLTSSADNPALSLTLAPPPPLPSHR